MNSVSKPFPDRTHTTNMTALSSEASKDEMAQRINAVDWHDVEEDLNQHGSAMLRGLLSGHECNALAALYARDELYRSRVVNGAPRIWAAANTSTSTIRCPTWSMRCGRPCIRVSRR